MFDRVLNTPLYTPIVAPNIFLYYTLNTIENWQSKKVLPWLFL